MLDEQTRKIAKEWGIIAPQIYQNIDGPGVYNTALVKQEERPEEGGIIVHLIGYRQPYKGRPDERTVRNMHIVKKVFLYAMQAVNNRTGKILATIVFLLPRFIGKKIAEIFINYFYEITEWVLYYDFLKPERYCVSVRELYRACTAVIEKQKEQFIKKTLTLIRDLGCTILEQDSAYRFRIQDIVLEIKKEKLLKGKKEMLAELERVFGILMKREIVSVYMRQKEGTIKKGILTILKFVKPARLLFQELAEEIDFAKLYPDEIDDYHNYLRQDYNFKGKTLEERIAIRKIIEDDNWPAFEPVAMKFLESFKIEIRKKEKEAVKL